MLLPTRVAQQRARPPGQLEFELASPEAVPAAATELAGQGHQLIHNARTEPWGQVTARVLGPEGIAVGVCYTPWLHKRTARAGDGDTGAGEADQVHVVTGHILLTASRPSGTYRASAADRWPDESVRGRPSL